MSADDGHRYVIAGGAQGVDRLRILGRIVAPTTRALLERAGVRPGMACLDVGCGGGDSTAALAAIAGPAGRVVGLDADATAIGLARQAAASSGLGHVEFRVGAAGQGEATAEYDVVYARFLLTHLGEPGAAVAWMLAQLRPRGLLVVEDIDVRGHFCDPPNAAFARYNVLYTELVQRQGADPFIGPRLPGLLFAAGCDDVGMQVVHPAGLDPDVKLMAPLTAAAIAARLESAGLASRAEVDALVRDLHAFAREPRSIMSLPRIVQAWGRAPG
jgi:SAM-dependent methyltransferase